MTASFTYYRHERYPASIELNPFFSVADQPPGLIRQKKEADPREADPIVLVPRNSFRASRKMGLIKILKRQPKEASDESVPSLVSPTEAKSTPEEREASYLEAKARIFLNTQSTGTTSSTGTIPIDASNDSKAEPLNRKAEYFFRTDEITDPE